MTVKFYTNPMSRGQIARWMLEEIGCEYEQHLMAYGPEGMGGAEYSEVNPMRKVPTIVHDDTVVTETAAICLYLADVFPDAQLGPTDAERGAYYRWTLFAAGPLEAAVTNESMGWHKLEDQKPQRMGYGTFERTMDTLDQHLQQNDYACGSRFTAADVYLGSSVDWGLAFGTMPKRASFEAYAARLRERAAYKKSKAIDGALIEAAQSS